MPSEPILVIGATGQLGGAIARQLLAAGHPVRAMSRTPARLEPLVSSGAEAVAGDLLDARSLDRACAGVSQVVTTANNAMGSGPASPNRVDVRAYQTLCAVLSRTGSPRLVSISALGLSRDNPVDFFRVKFAVDEVIQASGLSWVLIQPSAFMEIWVSQILGEGIRSKGVATLFGDGTRISNFISIEDVAAFTARVVADAGVRNEAVRIGGPSNLSYEQVAQLIERALGVRARRRHLPVPLLRWAPVVVRPFNEVAARLMSMGYWTATTDTAFTGWEASALRFGVTPISVEQYVAAHFGPPTP